MQLHDLLHRFNQYWQSQPVHDFPFPAAQRAAAVLIAVQQIRGELHVILTTRASHLLHHAGQVSFPGGKREPNDKTLVATALREAQEEIGIDPDNVMVIGNLPEYKTVSGFAVMPILGILTRPVDIHSELLIDENEVADVFQVPLSFLMKDEHFFVHHVSRNNEDFPVYFIPYEDRWIWGATAGMLALLKNHLSA